VRGGERSHFHPGRQDCLRSDNMDSINIMNADGKGIKVLDNASGEYSDSYPAVSPHGTKVFG